MAKQRTRTKQVNAPTVNVGSSLQQDSFSRNRLATLLGFSYGKDRNIFEALGYPQEKDLDVVYFHNKFSRNEIANAIIARPAQETWSRNISVVETTKEVQVQDSILDAAFHNLNTDFGLLTRFSYLDQLAAIGQFSLLLYGLNDVNTKADWKQPAIGKRKLLYVKQVSQINAMIQTYETNAGNERYGLPLTYTVTLFKANGGTGDQSTEEIVVHHSRVLHVSHSSLTSEYLGTPVLKPIINRILDLEKVLGGDAEMFWRGARPGYHAAAKDGYEMSDQAQTDLSQELDRYEHDLRRFINAQGVDIKALEQQIADPLGHIDAQLQAISAQTGIPKRILIGSERGELASSQDKGQWLTLIQRRMTGFAEAEVLRPFIKDMQRLGVLPEFKTFSIMWEDVFAPSELEKVEVGTKRADALQKYTASALAQELLPAKLAAKYLLGLTEEQYEEVQQALDEMEAEAAAGNASNEEEEILEEEESASTDEAE
jgi:hypothetical protein